MILLSCFSIDCTLSPASRRCLLICGDVAVVLESDFQPPTLHRVRIVALAAIDWTLLSVVACIPCGRTGDKAASFEAGERAELGFIKQLKRQQDPTHHCDHLSISSLPRPRQTSMEASPPAAMLDRLHICFEAPTHFMYAERFCTFATTKDWIWFSSTTGILTVQLESR